MARRIVVVALVFVLVVSSAVLFAVSAVPPLGSSPSSSSTVSASATPPESLIYNYSDFFNVPYGDWWDMRTSLYGDYPIGASCFNATSVSSGLCTTNVSGIPRVAHYPYEDWSGTTSGPGAGEASIYAPYRVRVNGMTVPGYNLSQPVFLPVFNGSTNPGSTLSFNWNMQYLDQANLTRITSSPLSCYSNGGKTADEGYQLVNRIYLTLDNQEAARLFGAQLTGTQGALQGWWTNHVGIGCSMATSGKNPPAGPLEVSVNNWFQSIANGKYDIYNAYAGAYVSLYTNITARVLSAGPTGLTQVYIEHGAWGTEALLSRWFFWGNTTYDGNATSYTKARGWWGMENGWWEGVHYAGKLQTTTMNFNLTGVLQFHFQEHSAKGPDGQFRSPTNLGDSDDIPYWTWGPQLMDYGNSSNSHPNSEMDPYVTQNYIKTTPGSADYGTNTTFDYTPVPWVAKTGETWNFVFPTGKATYYQNPDTATLGTILPNTQLPALNSTLSLQQIFPAGYGTWNAATNTWTVVGGTPESWPTRPYIPYPGIYLQPGGIPPTVTTSAATSVTTTGAVLNGNLGALGTASSVAVGFVYWTGTNTPGNVSSPPMTAAGPFSYSLTTLKPSTTYSFYAWASGSGFAKGSTLTFTTSALTYPVTFTETGLPSGTSWSVTLAGSTQSSTTSSIAYAKANGTYSYTIGSVPGYTANPSSGSVTVNGAAQSVAITFTVFTYSVTFSESGLPSGTSWSVTLAGSTQTSTASGITFAEANGTYTYSVGSVAGFTASPSSGSVTVSGASRTVTITFTAVTYSVTFSETGLAAGTSWSVTLAGSTLSSTTSSIVFSKANGTYSYTVGAVAGYTSSPSSGSLTVNGAAVSQAITFTVFTYPVTFTESGLPPGTTWSVTLAGSTLGSTTSSIGFAKANGSYGYTIGSVPGYTASPSSGSITVAGAAVSQAVTFSPVTFSVTFTETGLPSGTSWSVTLAGSTQTSTSTSIAFAKANGTYSYTIGAVPGYTSSPFSGSVTVSGSAQSIGVTFSAFTYAVTFTESGLPSGTLWSTTLAGSTQSSTTAAIAFSTANGTYGYTVGAVPGYVPAPSSGSVIVNGAPQNVAITFTPFTFAVTFTESGLTSGTSWSVTLNGATKSSTVASITFAEANGTYSYTVGAVPGYTASPSSGSITVAGAAVSQTIAFATVTYSVTFTESGLATGTSWSVTLAGSTVSSTTSSITFARGNGTYVFTVGALAGYTASPSSGLVTVNGAPVSQAIVFTVVTYTVTFTESGLPSGTPWSVTLAGSTQSSTAGSIGFSMANGTYSYTVGSVAGFTSSPTSGSVTVNGAPVSQAIAFTAFTYSVAFTETGLPSGTSWSVTLAGSTQTSTATSIAFATANGTYTYTIGAVPGFTASPLGGSVVVNGAAESVSVAFTVFTYSVMFTESGLPSGTSWSVTLDGVPVSSTTSSIAFAAANGTYPYAVGAVAGYTASPASGSLSVAGAGVNVPVTFTAIPPSTFAVTFTESGLPSSTSWSVTLNAATKTSTTSSIIFAEANGTYSYTIGSVPGYTASPSSGSVTVNGAAQSVAITFTVFTYSVTFSESGLPPGSLWSVTLAGSALSSTTSSIAFTEANGTFGFTVGSVAGFTANPSAGSVTVNGAPQTVAVTFSVFTYSVTFTESGLAPGTLWSVTLAGTTSSSTTSAIAFAEANGTYSYTIDTVPGYSASSSGGSITVNGAAVSEAVTFTAVTYSVTFTESGLASGTGWAVTLNGVVHSSTTSSVSFLEPNGTYAFAVGSLGGYTSSPSSGSITVNGASVSQTLTFTVFTYTVTFTESGLPSGTLWSLTLAGSTQSTTTSSLTFAEANGTYSYTVGSAAGFTSSPSSGSITVNGAPVSRTIAFTVFTYSVTFTESGLPSGTSWSVMLNEVTLPSTAASITFAEANGTYAFTVGSVSGYTANPTSGSVTVAGAPTTQFVAFTQVLYTVGFMESGLPSGTTWSVTLDGVPQSSTTGLIAFSKPNGDYGFSVASIAGFTASPASGTVTVNGAPVSVAVVFTPVTYAVTFMETGLASGTSWSVILDGMTMSSTTNAIGFAEANGTYSYTVGSIAGYTAVPASGSVTVDGAAQNVAVAFTAVTYTVTFTENGLPPGTSWSVTLAGSMMSSISSSIGFSEANGTYAYSVGTVPGYAAAPSSGSVVVNGAAVDVGVSFTSVVPAECADLVNRSAWAQPQKLWLSKGTEETLNAKVLNCGNVPVAVEIVFKVYGASGALVGTFVTPVYLSLAPGWNVTLTAAWVNPPAGKYTATGQAFYGAVGTTPLTPGASVKSFKFSVAGPKKGTSALAPIALIETPILGILGVLGPAVVRPRRPHRRPRAMTAAAGWLRERKSSRKGLGDMP